jgi:hypothetical protein
MRSNSQKHSFSARSKPFEICQVTKREDKNGIKKWQRFPLSIVISIISRKRATKESEKTESFVHEIRLLCPLTFMVVSKN